MLGAYSASKAAVEALGNTLRIELLHTGARVGVAYFGFIDTDMVKRGMQTRAVEQTPRARQAIVKPVPLVRAIDAIERGVERRAKRVTAPGWVAAVLPLRMLVQPLVDRSGGGLEQALAVARRGAGAADDSPARFSLTERKNAWSYRNLGIVGCVV